MVSSVGTKKSKSKKSVEKDRVYDSQTNPYIMIILAAKRARQLGTGDPPLISIESNHPCKIAFEEVRAGKVSFEKIST